MMPWRFFSKCVYIKDIKYAHKNFFFFKIRWLSPQIKALQLGSKFNTLLKKILECAIYLSALQTDYFEVFCVKTAIQNTCNTISYNNVYHTHTLQSSISFKESTKSKHTFTMRNRNLCNLKQKNTIKIFIYFSILYMYMRYWKFNLLISSLSTSRNTPKALMWSFQNEDL